MIEKIIAELKRQQEEIAEGALSRPKPDLFEYGRSCGHHQGIQLALDVIDSILCDEIRKEQRS